MTRETLAFEGAEGFGAQTVGGRGGQIVHVTNLNDSGEGSLRWALETVQGPRTVVFDVNGTIALSRQILIEHGNVTIAGQTAPGGGIVIEGSRIRIDASEVIVRGLIFRPGDGAAGMAPDDRDGLFIGSTDNVIRNVIIDHNSFSWSIDQNVAATGRVENVTFSNNIIAQGLSQSLHSKGEHSKGAGTGPWDTGQWNANNHISFIKNLMAHNTARNPEIGSGDHVELINNYIFNYGMGHIGTALGSSAGSLALTLNAIGNVYEPGLDTPSSGRGPVYMGNLGEGSVLHFADNLLTSRAVDACGDQDQTGLYWSAHNAMRFVTAQKAFAGSATQVLDSQQVAAHVLANAGARPGARDAVDARIVAGVADKTGRIVDSVAEAGGPAANAPVAAAPDTDRDGMPDWFETRYGFDPGVADDEGDHDGDGYTNVEEYLNGFFTGYAVGSPPPAPQPPALTLIQGTARNDIISIRKTTERAVENAGGGTDLVVAYVDYTLGDHIENLSLKGPATTGIGNGLANTITGTAGSDRIEGQGGDDKLKGLGGDDRVTGGDGKDWLEGNEGADRLEGGRGADTLMGGPGNDLFVFASGDALASARGAEDRVFDFRPGDRIVVDGAALDLTAIPDLYVARASYALAFAAAQSLAARGADKALVHGDRDSWLFWDADRDGLIDNGVTLSLASFERLGWAGGETLL